MNNLESIIESSVGLIWKVSKYFYGIPKEDLYQAGVLGIIKAYENDRDDGSTKFSTYAFKYIYGEMYQLAINKDIKVSKDLLRLVKMIEKGRMRLSQEIMGEPSNTELARFLEMDQEVMEAALLSVESVISMDEENDDVRTLYERVGANSNITPREVIRDFIELLDILYQNPNKKFVDIIGDEKFEFATGDNKEEEENKEFEDFEV